MTIIVSACLLGIRCRYDNKSKPCENIILLSKKHTLIPVCPEIFGGLPTPRVPAEILKDKVINAEGKDVTENYKRGAAEVLKLAKLYNAKLAILKEKSPACGSGKIYDGSFTHTLTDGFGICAKLLKENGIMVIGEGQAEKLLDI